mgnify:CR=1 FL=1
MLASAMSVKPAKAFGIYGKKGDIKPGFDADLLIVDPKKEWEITEESLLYVNKISAFVGLKGILIYINKIRYRTSRIFICPFYICGNVKIIHSLSPLMKAAGVSGADLCV